MSQEEILESAIRELTENALDVRRSKANDEERLQAAEVERLSVQAENVLSELPEDAHDILTAYLDAKELAADRDCTYLYVQGAKDVIKLLRELGVFGK